jgi:hypothetical protein
VKEAFLSAVAGVPLLVVFGARLLEQLPLSNSIIYLGTGVLLDAFGSILDPVQEATASSTWPRYP